jgi:LCP family protein required for cell wall assembly
MKDRHSSIDGFIPRSAGNNLGETANRNNQNNIFGASREKLSSISNQSMYQTSKQQSTIGIRRSDVDESLRDIDDSNQESSKKLSRKQRRRLKKMAKKPKSKIRRIIKWFIILIIIAVIGLGGYFAYKFIANGGNIFQGNFFDIFQSQSLKEDSNGRSNFLILGTTEDDPNHPGSNLTDTMMVVSIDQHKDNAYVFSVPRDLYVQYGMACPSGYEGKINEYFSCSDTGTSQAAEQDRLAKTEKFVGNIFGLDIQYGIHANLTVVRDAVNAVGGIDVNIVGDGAPGILDRNFDWRCNYTCYLVKYTNGVHHLNGNAAMYLAMARGDTAPTYGLANSNFDREKNQQKIIIALKAKAMSTGILTNVDAVTKLFDALGNNLRTNIQTKEIRTLMTVASQIKSSSVHTISLIDGDKSVVTTGGYAGQSIVLPSDGMFNYSGIQAFIDQNFSSNPVIREAAPIVVLNGTDQNGFGQTKADILSKDGFNVISVSTAPSGTYNKVEVFKIGSGDSATANKLSTMFNVKIQSTPPPVSFDSSAKFVVIFGSTN